MKLEVDLKASAAYAHLSGVEDVNVDVMVYANGQWQVITLTLEHVLEHGLTDAYTPVGIEFLNITELEVEGISK